MLELYTWNTPNGYKVPILLEELGVSYAIRPIDINAKQQKTASFSAMNPNQKIPLLVDTDANITVSESGAILIYLAEKYGSLLSSEHASRASQIQWLMYQMASVGPMLGQANHFLHYATKQIPYAIDRYTNEAARITKVLDGRLATSTYLGGEYSIADIATWPWIRKGISGAFIELAKYPHLARWYHEIESRPAVIRAIAKIDAAVKEAAGSNGPTSGPAVCQSFA